MTISEAILEYGNEHRDMGRRSNTWRSFAREVEAMWGSMSVKEAVMPVNVRQWIAQCRERKNAAATLRDKLAFLKALCRLSSEAGYPVAFPKRLAAGIVVDNARQRILTAQDLKSLEAAMHPSDWAIVKFLFKTGLRSQELFNLRVADCHFGKGTMHIRFTKTGRSRFVHMVGFVREYCANAARQRREYVVQPKGFDNYTTSRRGLGEAWKAQVFRPALRRAGIKDFRFHDGRHQCCTSMIDNGANPMAVSDAMGWTSGTYIKRYTNLQANSLKKAMALA